METNQKVAELETAGHHPYPVLEPGHTFGSLTDKILGIVLTPQTPLFWFVAVGVAGLVTGIFLYATAYLLYWGTGVWGVNIPVGWGFAIVNFVWWIGIGHAGTLISAILLLLRQSWRNSINRFAEAMTLFAVVCAGMFPVLHTGRPWLAYWLLPYPNTMGMWPQFRSPLLWDVFAVSTYLTISLLFWYIGLIPDLATLRDRTRSRFGRATYGILSMGWRGSARHWHRYETAYLLLAGLGTPLVLSVHTVVSYDFAVALVPGWHATIFPRYFVAGAIYSGFAMVMVLAIPIRKLYNLEDMITTRHLDNAAKIMLATGLIVGYGYVAEAFFAWYSGNIYEIHQYLVARMFGYYKWFYWGLIGINVCFIQVLWFRKFRVTPLLLWIVSAVVLVAMWLERFVIVVISLSQDFMVSNWGIYTPTRWDYMLFLGTLGLFSLLFLLFIRVLPLISVFEMKHLLSASEVKTK
ncbi:MAG: NrfD/PsrC family molybdoenzyme membrane anchor subunit [Candidatus Korobacteraceae bacterium]